MEILGRRRVLRCLILVCTVCLSPINRTLVLYGLNMHVQLFLRPSDKHVLLNIFFCYFSNKAYAVGAQKNRLDEAVLLSAHNIC